MKTVKNLTGEIKINIDSSRRYLSIHVGNKETITIEFSNDGKVYVGDSIKLDPSRK